ncbi:MAG: hypothetical protein IJT95_07170, partial [Abditibacteriota bacterium]|nr:hypothetical protein [Abditibacteriota bacterium]
SELKADEEDARRSIDNNYSFTAKNRRYEGVSLATLVRCLNKERIDKSTIIFHKGKPYRIAGFDGAKVTFSPVYAGKPANGPFKGVSAPTEEEEPKGNFSDAMHFYMYDMLHSTRGIVLLILFGSIIIIATIQFFMNAAAPKPAPAIMESNPMVDMPVPETQSVRGPVADMPQNGEIHWYVNTAGNTPVTINIPRSKDYYYVLIKNLDNGAKMLSVYLYKGKSIKITMPTGNFALYYTNFTSGEWMGPDTVGQYSRCARCNVNLSVTKGSRHTITLAPVSDNNPDITIVNYDEFIR